MSEISKLKMNDTNSRRDHAGKRARCTSNHDDRSAWTACSVECGGSIGGESSRNRPHKRTSSRDVSDVLTLLDACEHEIRETRKTCHADSEAFSNRCTAVLDGVSTLQFRASQVLHGPDDGAVIESGNRNGPSQALADPAWFCDVARAIDLTRGFIARTKAEHHDIRKCIQADALRQAQVEGTHAVQAGEPAPEKREIEQRRDDLLATLHRVRNMSREVSRAGLAAEEPLRACANEAADWTCAASECLKNTMCAHDSSLVRMAEHAATKIEAHGNNALARGDELLAGGSAFEVGQALTCLVQAKAAFDEVYGIKVFSGQRPPTLKCPILAQVSGAGCLV